jgi:hypothetical protein
LVFSTRNTAELCKNRPLHWFWRKRNKNWLIIEQLEQIIKFALHTLKSQFYRKLFKIDEKETCFVKQS